MTESEAEEWAATEAAELAWRKRKRAGVAALLREQRRLRGISSDGELARRLGLAPVTLSRLLSAQRDLGPTDESRLGVGLGLSPEQLAQEAAAAGKRAALLVALGARLRVRAAPVEADG